MLTKKNPGWQRDVWIFFWEKKLLTQSKPSPISHQLKKQKRMASVYGVMRQSAKAVILAPYHCLKVSISSAVMDLWFTHYLDFAKCLLQIFQRALDSYRKAPWKLCSLKDLQTSSPIPFNELGFLLIFRKRQYQSSDSMDFGPSKSFKQILPQQLAQQLYH